MQHLYCQFQSKNTSLHVYALKAAHLALHQWPSDLQCLGWRAVELLLLLLLLLLLYSLHVFLLLLLLLL
jgi:hypothetical protein